MKIFWILLWPILIFSSTVLASEIEFKADIEQVVLYPDMAMIKKTGRVSLRHGENVLMRRDFLITSQGAQSLK